MMAVHDIVHAHIRSFNNHDAKAWADRYATDAAIHDPQYPEPLRGRAAIRKDIDDFLVAFPDMQFTVANVVGTAELVALEGVGVGTHRGPMETPGGAIPPTNRSVSMPFAAFVRLNSDGLITEERRYYDVAGMLQQLGLLSEPAA